MRTHLLVFRAVDVVGQLVAGLRSLVERRQCHLQLVTGRLEEVDEPVDLKRKVYGCQGVGSGTLQRVASHVRQLPTSAVHRLCVCKIRLRFVNVHHLLQT